MMPPLLYLRAVELRNQGKTRHQIAAELGVSVNRASGLLHYARTNGIDVPRDPELKPRLHVKDLARRREKGSFARIGTVGAAVNPLTRAEYDALMRNNKSGESLAETLVRLALIVVKAREAAESAGKAARP